MLIRHPIARGSTGAILLSYTDAQGDGSERQVMPLAIVTDDLKRNSASTYIEARCSSARAVRTFRVDRIGSLADAQTGELFTTQEWLAGLRLGAGKPFAADDRPPTSDRAILGAPTTRPARSAASQLPDRQAVKRFVAVAAIAYLIGRLRLVSVILHLLHVRTGVTLWSWL